MRELEKELSQKTSSVSELKRQLKERSEREDKAQKRMQQLEDQVINNSDPVQANATA